MRVWQAHARGAHTGGGQYLVILSNRRGFGRHLREERTQAAARLAAFAGPRGAGQDLGAAAGGPAQRRAAATAARALKATHFLLGDLLDLVRST